MPGAGEERRQRGGGSFGAVGLAERASICPMNFRWSGQRVAIARALANQPPLIMADEPTGNLDSTASVEIMELFTSLYEEGATVVVVTHEEEIAAFTNGLSASAGRSSVTSVRKRGAESCF